MTDFVALARDNLALAACVAFGGGVMTSLTPCVYPVIAITIAVFGARKAGGRWQAAALSLTFAGGIVATYTPLGVASALTGTLFGALLASRWFTLLVAALFVAMALSLFGLFTIQLPASLRGRFASVGRAGFAGAFLMGVVSGLVAAPCTGPVLAGILTFVAATRSVAVGALLLFSFSLGLSLLFVIVGTFAMSLPKSGKWLDGVKDALGAAMLLLALYFARFALPLERLADAVPRPALWAGLGAAAAGLALLVAGHTVVHRRAAGGDGRAGASFHAARAAALALLVAGGALALLAALRRPVETRWIRDDEKGALALRAEKKAPMVIDFTALWCEACGKLDKKTFSDARVRKEFERFVLLRMDFTENDEYDEKMQEKYGIDGGLPTVIIMDSSGREAKRINEFVGPEKFLPMLLKVR